jgi:hypothetical protein
MNALAIAGQPHISQVIRKTDAVLFVVVVLGLLLSKAVFPMFGEKGS